MISVELSEGISETLDILNHMDRIYVDKIPENFKNFLERNKSKTYIPKLDHSKKLYQMNLKEDTKNILATIYIHYWANLKEKAEYNNILTKNEKKYQDELRKKYNPYDLFKNKNSKVEKVEKTIDMMEYKETIFTKIKNWFKWTFK